LAQLRDLLAQAHTLNDASPERPKNPKSPESPA
jgi:hypothetical protein